VTRRLVIVASGNLTAVVEALREAGEETILVVDAPTLTVESPRNLGKAFTVPEIRGWEEFPAAELLGPPTFARYGKTREVCSGCRHKHAAGVKCDRYVSLRRAGSRPCGCVR
jgi:hypothetical protein